MSCPFPMNGTDFFLCSPRTCALCLHHILGQCFLCPHLEAGKIPGYFGFWLRCLGGNIEVKSYDFLQKDGQKTLEFWDLSFFKVKFWDWNSLVGLILNDCVASGSLQQRTWRWDKRPMHLFDGITLALKQWMVWMRPFGTLVLTHLWCICHSQN